MSQDPVPDAGPESPEGEPPRSAPSEAPAPVSARDALLIALGVTAATGLTINYAFDPARAGKASMLVAMGALYVVTAAAAIVRLRWRGELRQRFRPIGGDMSIGAAVAGILYGFARIVQHLVAARGSPGEAWIVRLYLQLGDPDAPGRKLVGLGVFLVAALEEITWRGLVMRSLEDAIGGRRALLLSSLLFGVAHAPTLFLLGDPVAGLNPLVVLAAVGCSLVWGLLVLRTGRLVPALCAHAIFSWAIVEFPIWRP